MQSHPSRPEPVVRGRDIVATATTVCLAATVLFLYVWVLPWYVAVMEANDYAMPVPYRVASSVMGSAYARWALLIWVLVAVWRRRRAGLRALFPLQRTLVAVNVASVVVLVALTTGFASFAMHGLSATRKIVAPHAQATPTSSLRQH